MVVFPHCYGCLSSLPNMEAPTELQILGFQVNFDWLFLTLDFLSFFFFPFFVCSISSSSSLGNTKTSSYSSWIPK